MGHYAAWALAALISMFACVAAASHVYVPQWQQLLPPTPTLPRSNFEGTTPINNVQLWYALYGKDLTAAIKDGETPILVLHGGHISSRWMSDAIKHFAKKRAVIAFDTRGHGRSTDDLTVEFSYDLFARDAIALLDHLHVPKVAIFGWSDGGISGLDIAMNHPSRLDRLYAYGANYLPSQANPNLEVLPYLLDVVAREQSEYEAIAPESGNFTLLSEKLDVLHAMLPQWDQENFSLIPTPYQDSKAPAIWLADGDHEEFLIQGLAREMSEMINGSSWVIHPGVSHFGLAQDPDTFLTVLDRWLAYEQFPKSEGAHTLQ